MKIVQAAGWYYPDSIGGIEVYTAGLSKRLQLVGHEVFIIAPHIKNSQERSYDYEGLSVYRYPIPPYPTRKESLGLVPLRGTEYFRNWLLKLRPDVVHFQSLNLGLGVSQVKAAKARGARVILTSHPNAQDYFCKRGTLLYRGKEVCDGIRRVKRCASCVLEKKHMPRGIADMIGLIPPVLGRFMMFAPYGIGTALGMSYLVSVDKEKYCQLLSIADKFVVLTQASYDMAISNGFPREKLFLNKLGISENYVVKKVSSSDAPTRKPVKIGYLGRFDEIKGIFDFTKAVASLSADIPFSLEFVGPVLTLGERPNLEKMKAMMASDKRVVFSPTVAHEKVFDLLRGYDVLCCPSSCFEGPTTTALEAYAVGTPVIGTKIGGLAEIITDKVNGRLFNPGDWQALAEIIKEISIDPAGTIDQWRKNIPTIRTMDQITKDYLEIYSA